MTRPCQVLASYVAEVPLHKLCGGEYIEGVIGQHGHTVRLVHHNVNKNLNSLNIRFSLQFVSRLGFSCL